MRSPSTVRASRSTPCAAGCCGPMLSTTSELASSPVDTMSSVLRSTPAMPAILADLGLVAPWRPPEVADGDRGRDHAPDREAAELVRRPRTARGERVKRLKHRDDERPQWEIARDLRQVPVDREVG